MLPTMEFLRSLIFDRNKKSDSFIIEVSVKASNDDTIKITILDILTIESRATASDGKTT